MLPSSALFTVDSLPLFCSLSIFYCHAGRIFFIVMPSMLNVVFLIVILSVFKLRVNTINVTVPRVVAPSKVVGSKITRVQF